MDQNQWRAFDGKFSANLVMPDYLGIGNGITRGFGTISNAGAHEVGLFDSNEFDKLKSEAKNSDFCLEEGNFAQLFMSLIFQQLINQSPKGRKRSVFQKRKDISLNKKTTGQKMKRKRMGKAMTRSIIIPMNITKTTFYIIMKFADRVDKVKPSFTLEMTSRAAELKHAGHDVINFSAGQPDFNTPDNIISAAKSAMDNGLTKYTSGAGMIDLREAICKKVERENKISISPEQVLVSNGEKQSLYLACQVLFQAGDEVIIFSPYWVSFPEFVTLSDATPVLIDTESKNNFEPAINDILNVASANTKGIIINSPSNPTGSVWSEEKITEILKIAEEKNWTVISDECYERLVFDQKNTISQKLQIIII